jgi:hypothetical protein
LRADGPCVILCHHRSRHAAARQWLRTHGGRNPAGASGSPHRLLQDLDGRQPLGEEPLRPPGGGRWGSACSAQPGPRDSRAVARTPADIGVSPSAGASLCRLTVRSFICAITPAAGREPARVRAYPGCALRAECDDRPRANRLRAGPCHGRLR